MKEDLFSRELMKATIWWASLPPSLRQATWAARALSSSSKIAPCLTPLVLGALGWRRRVLRSPLEHSSRRLVIYVPPGVRLPDPCLTRKSYREILAALADEVQTELVVSIKPNQRKTKCQTGPF